MCSTWAQGADPSRRGVKLRSFYPNSSDVVVGGNNNNFTSGSKRDVVTGGNGNVFLDSAECASHLRTPPSSLT